MKVLVAFSSKGTIMRQIAARVAGVLTRSGYQVETADADDVTSVGDCEAVVLGSALSRGRWLPGAVEFLESFQEELARIPVFLFSYRDRTGAENAATGGWVFPADLEGVVHAVRPRSVELFVVATPDARRNGDESASISERYAGVGADGPDWRAVERWAGKVAGHLLRESHGRGRRPLPS